MAPAIFGLRVWLAFISLVNLSIVIAFHAWFIPFLNELNKRKDFLELSPYEYDWVDYTVIITSVLLLLSYLYSIWGKPRVHKFVRAFLMLLCACLLLGVQLRQVDLAIRLVKRHSIEYNPFSCSGADDSTIAAACGLQQGYTFIPIVTGFFAIIEVFVTLFRGPLHPPKAAYY
ncbi:hypothetical protein BGX23_011436 [Mortierella sp. AD031]|nr:hypothetical protein BGX23_011436 [Mortierella sp. AD031]KAG0203365.1 hypothetical protein BGX33_009150 [Mortierella sp. NVP41]